MVGSGGGWAWWVRVRYPHARGGDLHMDAVIWRVELAIVLHERGRSAYDGKFV